MLRCNNYLFIYLHGVGFSRLVFSPVPLKHGSSWYCIALVACCFSCNENVLVKRKTNFKNTYNHHCSNMDFMWSLFLIGQLDLSGIWQALLGREDTKNIGRSLSKFNETMLEKLLGIFLTQ